MASDTDNTTLGALGEHRFRATVQICPQCLSLFDGEFDGDICPADNGVLIWRRVAIADD